MAAKPLVKGPKKFYEFLQKLKAGDVVSESDVLTAVPNWNSVSFTTYKGKNKIAPFLCELPDGTFRVVNDGEKLTPGHLHEVFTQVKPEVIDPHKGDRLTGKNGTYVLESLLGAGAVGQVWKAIQESTAAPVALKVMLPRADLLEPSTLDNVTERFRREARNGLKLDHPRIVRHLDIGEWGRTPFFILQLADGSLGAELKIAPVTVKKAREIVLSCVEGLIYLHSEGCIHRDVKPDNILR